ncbi:MAG: thiol reductant ABC exporter subunit CydC [Actinomycetota bacterium]|nr:thiol reductant ABC exporter subunit CydC [Actinomycetota bacterium]
MRVFLRLLGFLWPYRLRVALAIFLGVATVIGNVGLLATAAYVISAAAIVPFISLLGIPIFMVRFFSVSRSFSRYAERLVSHDVTFRLLGNLRTRFYARLAPLAPARLSGYRSGDLLSRIMRDVEELENVYLRATSPVAIAAIVTALVFALFYLFDLVLAFVVLGFLVATGVGVPLLVGGLSRGLGRRQLELRAELNARIVDGVQGVQDLLAFGREEEQRAEIAALNRKLDRVQRRMAFVTGLQNSVGDLMTGLAMLAALVVAVPLVAEGEVGGVYLAFLALVVLGCFEAVLPLGSAFQFMGRSIGAGERLFEVADQRPAVTDPEEPLPGPADHTLEFDRVSFRYGGEEPLALEDVSFDLKPGDRVAVVGPSGAGKSTISNLILRVWDPAAGEVRLGGHSLDGYAQDEVRSLVGVVSQSAHAFNGTLRANLLLANPGAGDAALEEALSRAQLSGLLERLPKGLDTYVGEQGARLSGGERQRLAVARTLLKDAPLLVLDEATANLDPVTERELMGAVREHMRDRSTLTITHRLVGMEAMDEILVLDGGRIVERGTHEELAGAGGLYARMLEVQNRMLASPRENRQYSL